MKQVVVSMKRISVNEDFVCDNPEETQRRNDVETPRRRESPYLVVGVQNDVGLKQKKNAFYKNVFILELHW